MQRLCLSFWLLLSEQRSPLGHSVNVYASCIFSYACMAHLLQAIDQGCVAGMPPAKATQPTYVPRLPDQLPSPLAPEPRSMPLNPTSNTPGITAATVQLPQMVKDVNAAHYHCSTGLQSARSGAPKGSRYHAAKIFKNDTEFKPSDRQKESIALTTMPRNPTAVVDSYRTESLCIVCWGIEPSWMCVPCGHIAMCRACSQAVKEQTNVCPVCQQAIVSLQELSLG